MTTDEVIDLLTLIAARDRRTVGKVDVAVWREDIGDLDFTDCRRAVADHFREKPSVWLMAGHVRDRVKTMRAERLEYAERVVPAADPDDPEAYLAAYRAQVKAIADGRVEVPAIEAGTSMPDEENPHVKAIIAEFHRMREAKLARERAEKARHAEAARAYIAAVEVLLDLPDHGAEAVKQATDRLFNDVEAAAGYPLRDEAIGVTDRQKIVILAARTVAEQGPS